MSLTLAFDTVEGRLDAYLHAVSDPREVADRSRGAVERARAVRFDALLLAVEGMGDDVEGCVHALSAAVADRDPRYVDMAVRDLRAALRRTSL